jgi:magnesium transporter
MFMLSTLRQFELTIASGRRARLDDLAVNLLDGNYPPVTRLVFRDPNHQLLALPWDAVIEFDLQYRRVRVTDFEAAQPAEATPKEEVLLYRDVLDALVLDLQNRRATRANDLCLKGEGGRLLLQAADVSARAILRRLSRGLFGREPSGELYDWKYVEFLRGDPRAVRSGAGYHLRITRLPPGEIARLSEAMPYLHAAELLTLLPDPLAADTLEVMLPERQLQIFEELDDDEAVRLLGLMAPDVAADLLGRLHVETARRVLEQLSSKQRERIIDLLRYPERTVGGVMTNDVITAPESWTVAEARERLRERIKESDFAHFIYIVDDEENSRLRGALTLRDLFIADADRRLDELMTPYLLTLSPLEDAVIGAYRVIESHLAALPVIEQDGRLLGAVMVDIAVSQVAPPNWSVQMPRVFS